MACRAVVWTIAAALSLSGCAKPADVQPMTVERRYASPQVSAGPLFRSIAIVAVEVGPIVPQFTRYGKTTTDNPVGSATPENFGAALTASLAGAGMLAAGPGETKFNLEVYVHQPNTNVEGFVMSIPVYVRYTVRQRTTNRLVYVDTIETTGSATFADASLSVDRFKLASERGYRRNIEAFMNALILRANAASFAEPARR